MAESCNFGLENNDFEANKSGTCCAGLMLAQAV